MKESLEKMNVSCDKPYPRDSINIQEVIAPGGSTLTMGFLVSL